MAGGDEPPYVRISSGDYHVLHPRPAYLIVSRKREGGYNVMAASWVMPVSEEPPLLVAAVERDAYTMELIRESGEFTVNVMGEEHVDIVYRAGTVSGRRVDKWRMLGLEPLEPLETSTPGIRGAYAVLECRVREIYPAGECFLVLAEIASIRVQRDKYTRYGWDLRKARILMHNSGRAFTVPGRLVFAKKHG